MKRNLKRQIFIATRLVWIGASLVSIAATASPGTVLSEPGNDSTRYGPVVIKGRASDDVGVQRVDVVFRNVERNTYWNGLVWQSDFVRFPVPVVTTGSSSTAWRARIPTTALEQGRYVARAWTVSTRGNGDPTGNARTEFEWRERMRATSRPIATEVDTGDDATASVALSWLADDDERRVAFDLYIDDRFVAYLRDPNARRFVFEGLSPDTTYRLGVSSLAARTDDGNDAYYSPRRTVEFTTAAATTEPIVPPTPAGGRPLVYAEEFDSLDTSRWRKEHSTYGDGNNELQCYTPQQVSIADGKLVLKAESRTETCPNGSTRRVTSGMVRSRGIDFSPGQYIEYRVKLTPADERRQGGLWPAFWASGFGGGGWPRGGEWDGLEVMTARDPKRAAFNLHYLDSDSRHAQSPGRFFLDQPFSAAWHVLGFDYGRDGHMKWYLDNELVHEVRDADTLQGWPRPFDVPMTELKINLALGGNPGPLDAAALPATYEIDYVRLYGE